MSKRKVILGKYVDVVNGKVIDNGGVIIEDEKIVYTGLKENAVLNDDDEIYSLDGGTILPGFIDCHAHLTGCENDDYVFEPIEKMTLKAAYDMGVMLESGFTAARDMTRISPYLKWAVDKGYFKGPHIVCGGQVLSITGGHGEFNTDYPLEIKQVKDNVIAHIVDGVDGCLRGVRKQFREGAEFIKICATGGVSSMADGLEDVQFSSEELKVIVEEAKRHGTYVAAHCSGLAGTKQALKAGIKTVEHGINLDEECVAIMKENDCSLTTTLNIALHLKDYPNLPDFMARKAALCADANLKSIELVRKAGINVALGTDFSNKEESSNNFKHLGKEFVAICEAGFSNMESLQIGTINGAKVMMKEDVIGSLDVGKFADVVIVEGNPLEDINVLADADNIKFVMKMGNVIKNKIDTF